MQGVDKVVRNKPRTKKNRKAENVARERARNAKDARTAS